jgi:trehalose 6-phosphate phosphatase
MKRFDFFWKRLRCAEQPILLLDYDGTLAPFRAERSQAVPYSGVRELLSAILATKRTRLVVVTGRPCHDLVALLGIDPHPEIWGCHGWEQLLSDGRHKLGQISSVAQQALEEACQWAQDSGFSPNCEIKPVSTAFHWRGLSEATAAELRQQALTAWQPLATAGGLQLHDFDGGLELRCPGQNKGTAVRQVIADAGHDTAIAYLGDDLTDEDAFIALQDRALTLLVRKEPRPTAADYRLQPPEELIAFLQAWLQQTSVEKE